MDNDYSVLLVVAGACVLIAAILVWLFRSWVRRVKEQVKNHRRAFEAFAESIGLVNAGDPRTRGWSFLARGVSQNIPISMGIRSRSHRTPEGGQTGMEHEEISAQASADRGKYLIQRKELSISVIPDGGRCSTGDAGFDACFVVVPRTADPSHASVLASPFEVGSAPETPPWLDAELRSLLLATPQIAEVEVEAQLVTAVLWDPTMKDVSGALEVVIRVVTWPSREPQLPAYR